MSCFYSEVFIIDIASAIIHVGLTGSYDQSLFVRHHCLWNWLASRDMGLVITRGFQSEFDFHVSNHSVSGWQGIVLRNSSEKSSFAFGSNVWEDDFKLDTDFNIACNF